MYNNILYFDNINSIGGVESFFYYISKLYNDLDIAVVYSTGDKKQIERLRKNIKVIKHTGQKIKCKNAYFNYSTRIIDDIEAEHYKMILHTNYANVGYKFKVDNRIDEFIAVSKLVADEFYKLTGKKAKVIYNPLYIEKPKKVLLLISATRLTKEKGYNRMVRLKEELKKHNIPFMWLVFTDKPTDDKDFVFMKPTLEINNYIVKADYMVQLSDKDIEGYSYTINESLSLGVPIISTKQAIYEELGINESNSIIIDDFNNIPIKEICEHKFDFKYEPPKSEWRKEFAKGKTKYNTGNKYLIRATRKYKKSGLIDATLKRIPKENEEWVVDLSRLEYLLENQNSNDPYIEIVEGLK